MPAAVPVPPSRMPVPAVAGPAVPVPEAIRELVVNEIVLIVPPVVVALKPATKFSAAAVCEP